MRYIVTINDKNLKAKPTLAELRRMVKALDPKGTIRVIAEKEEEALKRL